MVPAVRSTVHYVDSGYLWGNIIRKGGNVREKQGTVVEEVHKIGKWDTGCLYIPERHQSNRHPAATHSFVEWMRNAVENVTGIVAIDGKQARRTKDARKPPLHVVSAFSAECRLVLLPN